MLDPTSQTMSSNQGGVVVSAQGWPTPDDPDFYMDLDFPTWPAAPATQGRAIVNSYLICKLKNCVSPWFIPVRTTYLDVSLGDLGSQIVGFATHWWSQNIFFFPSSYDASHLQRSIPSAASCVNWCCWVNGLFRLLPQRQWLYFDEDHRRSDLQGRGQRRPARRHIHLNGHHASVI